MKRFLCAFCLLLCAAVLFMTAAAEEEKSIGELRSDGKYVAKLTRTIKFTGDGLNDHYRVQQGAATDGEFGYFLLESKVTGSCALFKIDLETWETAEVKYDVPVEHGNGMTYNSRTNQFVVVHWGPTENRLSFIDRDTLEVVGTKDMPFNMVSIAYDAVNDRYAVGVKGARQYCVLDADFNVTATYDIPGGYKNNQDADCDENYIYLIEWREENLYASSVVVVDWEGNLVNYIQAKSLNEIESMFHVGDRIILPFYSGQADIYEAELTWEEK